jgi:hypothetical protein
VNRKMVGIFTAVVAALLLVGVAWASSDSGRDDPDSSSTQVSPTSDVSTPGSQTEEVTGTSVDRLTGSGEDDNSGSTPTTIDDNDGSTPTTIDDNGGDRDNSGSDDNGDDDNGGDRDD